MDAKELLEQFARGERNFNGASLERVNLERFNLTGAQLERATLTGANLSGANLTGANLSGANLSGAQLNRTNLKDAYLGDAKLTGARFNGADLSRANLSGSDLGGSDLNGAVLIKAQLSGASLERANLTGVDFRGSDLNRASLVKANLSGANLNEASLASAVLGGTILIDLNLEPFCRSSIIHYRAGTVDFSSIIKSVNCPNLNQFLRDTGMPQIVVDSMIKCAQALSPTEMLSTFISYGGPDEAFAHLLYQALKDSGVTTFFYPFDAKLGEWIADAMHRGIREHDRVVVVCSKLSLSRSGLRAELNEVRRKEATLGGESCLIPIRIDDYVISDEFKTADPELAQFLQERVVGDFRGTDRDNVKFKVAFARLSESLRRPIVRAAK